MGWEKAARCVMAPVGAALLAVVPSTAGAATVSVDAGAAAFVAEGDEQNQLRVVKAAAQLRFSDAGAKLTAGSGCVAVNERTVECPLALTRTIRIELGSGDDVAIVTSNRKTSLVGSDGADVMGGGQAADTISGGAGVDLIGGGGGDDLLRGGSAGDLLKGGGGRDRLLAGAGNDVLQAGEGQDLLGGGGGRDQLFPGGDGVPDRVNCGAALDFALARRVDRLRGCEFVKRR